MAYFVTGATGFIGRFLVAKLLAARQAGLRAGAQGLGRRSSTRCARSWGADEKQVIAVVGDLTKPTLGVSDADLRKLKGKIDHFFHLAAIYDLTARGRRAAGRQRRRHAPRRRASPRPCSAGCFHHVSSIAAAGLYDGVFREDMFEEAEDLDHPYFRTKHDSEGVVRRECKRPLAHLPARRSSSATRKTGEIDKIDGPYYFFKLIQKMRQLLPPWMPTIGIEGGRINIVPVDFVADAMDHIAHKKGLDGKCFHLTDPEPHRIGEVLNIFAKAAHAPQMTMRVNARMFGFIPAPIVYGLGSLAPVKRAMKVVLTDLGIPRDVFQFINWPTRYDNREAAKALKGSGIEVPPLDDLRREAVGLLGAQPRSRPLHRPHARRPRARTRWCVVTGGSSGIGQATALKLAEAGAKVVIVARDPEKLGRREAGDRGRGRDAASPTPATSRTWRRSTRWRRRCSPTTAASTSSSTTRAARSAARCSTRSTASTTSSARCSSTTSARCS